MKVTINADLYCSEFKGVKPMKPDEMRRHVKACLANVFHEKAQMISNLTGMETSIANMTVKVED